jgi:ribosomal protein S7
MNGYDLSRLWFDYKFENPGKVKAIHSDFFFYLVDQWNRLGQKEKFGVPTSYTMECLGIGSYNTYKKTFNDLVEFGFVKLIQDSVNQHQSRIVALSKNDKALDKALDKATIKATDKALDKALDTIDKQLNNETIQQLNNKTKPLTPLGEVIDFDSLLIFYNKTFSKKSRIVTDSVKKKFNARMKEGFLKSDIMNAMKNASEDVFHKENGYKHCTLEFFSRADKIDKFSNINETIKLKHNGSSTNQRKNADERMADSLRRILGEDFEEDQPTDNHFGSQSDVEFASFENVE